MLVLQLVPTDRQTDEALMREFWRHVRRSGRLQESRARRFHQTEKSRNIRRRSAQVSAERRAEREYQMKIGRLSPRLGA